MAPNGEASSAVVAAVAPFLATFIGNHHLGHGGDGHGHKEQQQVVEEAECECCGMSEECTAAYAGAVRRRFSGRWVCGLCAEAVAEEAGKKKGGEREAALAAHMAALQRLREDAPGALPGRRHETHPQEALRRRRPWIAQADQH
uniref:DUF1677 family protein n=1 Tax=Oryza barthii TaxID=65489 RepID=A0A0D3G2V1_9ORYZ